MSDVIVGAITKYTPEDIKPWVESINQCGFEGGRVMLVYRVPQETIDYLKSEGFQVFGGSNLDMNVGYRPIVVKRFIDLYSLFSMETFEYDRAIVTDVKDVIFQSNPSKWFDENQTRKIVVGSESIKIKDMEWSARNYSASYPIEYSRIQDKVSHCAGVIGGDVKALADFFLAIYRWSLNGANYNEPPDQAALNVLINLDFYKDQVQKVTHSDGWVTHLGVSLDNPEGFGPYLTDDVPQIQGDVVVNSNKEPFVIVHQYDRIPSLNEKILNQYK